jgi:LysM repeat protein
MIKLLIFFGFSFLTDGAEPRHGDFSAPLMDSIGVETVNGKTFVLHRVDEKETLYAISRRYRTTVDAIIDYNKGAADGLEIGEVLKVPYTPRTASNKTTEGLVHEVQPRETMFSIARKYGVTVDEIKQWNNLTSTSLSIGQAITIKKKSAAPAGNTNPTALPNQSLSKKGAHTVAPQETLYSIARQYGVTTQQLTEWNSLSGTDLKVGQVIMVTEPERTPVSTVKKPEPQTTTTTNTTTPVTKPVEGKRDPEPVKQATPEPTTPAPTIRISESVRNGSETVEAGIAELIDGTEGNRKYLALHRTAPIGTILKVKNEMNNREVFVRVMGKLPDTALTDKVIIRISKSAYDRLGAIDQRFRVEVTYYK